MLWGDASHGVASIVLSWLLSPLIAAALGAALFTASKLAVLTAPNPAARMRALLPAYLAATFAVVIFFMALVGAPRLGLATKTPSGRKTFADVGAVCGVTLALAAAVGVAAHFASRRPWFDRYLQTLPLGEAPAGSHGQAAGGCGGGEGQPVEMEMAEGSALLCASGDGLSPAGAAAAAPLHSEAGGGAAAAAPLGLKGLLLSGVDVDVVTPQTAAAQAAHDKAVRYDPHAERLFTAAQVRAPRAHQTGILGGRTSHLLENHAVPPPPAPAPARCSPPPSRRWRTAPTTWPTRSRRCPSSSGFGPTAAAP